MKNIKLMAVLMIVGAMLTGCGRNNDRDNTVVTDSPMNTDRADMNSGDNAVNDMGNAAGDIADGAGIRTG